MYGFTHAGIQTDSVLSARLQIIRIFIREDGRLVIEFKTHAKFRGGSLSTASLTWPIKKHVSPEVLELFLVCVSVLMR